MLITVGTAVAVVAVVVAALLSPPTTSPGRAHHAATARWPNSASSSTASRARRPAAMPGIDLSRVSISDLQRALTSHEITSVELVNAYLTRIRQLDRSGPKLNAVRAINPRAVDEARQADLERRQGRIRGPLHGIPVLVKDNIDVAGMPTTAGALALKDSVPPSDAFLVGRLRAEGAVILGKTNLTEFANFTTSGMPPGFSTLGGQVVNPYDRTYTPAGSSAGSGVAAAAGLAAVTVGTETAGSILSPAVVNSVVGVKPTVGLISRRGIIPISASQDTAGPIARSVSDAATLLTTLAGPDPDDQATVTGAPSGRIDYTKALSDNALRHARIGVASRPGGADGAALAAATKVLTRQGATVVNVSVSTKNLPRGILSYEFKRDLNAYLDRLPPSAPMHSLDDIVRFNRAHASDGAVKFGQSQLAASNAIDLDDPETKARYESDRDEGIVVARRRIDTVLSSNDVDAIVFIGSGSAAIGARAQYPSVAVPIGYDHDNGRPIGMTLLGTAYSEARLLALAYAYEQAAHVWHPPPVVTKRP